MELNEVPAGLIPLFRGIKSEDMFSLFNCLNARINDYQKGDYIQLQQKSDPLVGIILSGAVHMMKEDVWGHQYLIAHYSEGELFGETTSLGSGDEPYISFLAAQASQILFLSMKHLLHPCREQCPFHLNISQNMFELVLRKNNLLMERIEILSQKALRDKILAYLSFQSQKQGSRYIKVPFNRTEMASYLQSNRSAMTRELADMKSSGLIDYDGNTFILK